MFERLPSAAPADRMDDAHSRCILDSAAEAPMRSKTTRSVAILTVLLLVSASTASERAPARPSESYTRQLVEGVLPETCRQWDGYEFAQRGSRGATYVAAGLLWRDGPDDRAAAASALRGVLDLQYDDGPGSKLHGVFRRHRGETEHDSNWREFVGCGLILILETFPDRLPADLIRDMKAALLRAAEGAVHHGFALIGA